MSKRSAAAPQQFRAVSIESDWRGCCDAAKAVAGQRFLGGEAPMLPLENCGTPGACHCVYKHWSDRRCQERRSPYAGLASQLHQADDRRSGDDRRK